MPRISISIDGPTASGKTTLATDLAQFLGLAFLDTGLTFRSLALAHFNGDTENLHHHLGSHLKHHPAVYGTSGELVQRHRIFLHEKEITEDIWNPSMDDSLKTVSRDPAVRRSILQLHREVVGTYGDIVVVGRDVAVTLLPAATLKIYLTASLAVRRERRRAQYRLRGRSTAVGPPTERDAENRVAVRSLPDSVEIDSTYLPASAVSASAMNRLHASAAWRSAVPAEGRVTRPEERCEEA
ncbi:(d)CMP kinase [Streptomyces zingiberis]|uniref:(d)CMP kinase n=1 Tax=Streptomyces zingiberis TaxID=2053010 RepID=A0ABX1BT32_9ACTN|nr:(d)CMP kinase [Streptomyces zingiberis]NJP99575.1 hypothetical protein [Streptomyces zingiberis]